MIIVLLRFFKIKLKDYSYSLKAPLLKMLKETMPLHYYVFALLMTLMVLSLCKDILKSIPMKNITGITIYSSNMQQKKLSNAQCS